MSYRSFYFYCLLILLISLKAHGQQLAFGDTIALKLEYHSGFGPFLVGGAGFSDEESQTDSPFSDTHLPVKGVPASWTDVKKQMIVIDYQQFLHQNIKNGNITQEQLDRLKAAGWKIDSANILPGFVKCYVYAATGKDSQQRTVAVVDQNNNLDFSDDPVLYPPDMSVGAAELEKSIVKAKYERNQLGRKRTDTVPILLMQGKHTVYYSIPQHATTVLRLGGKSHQIVVGAEGPITRTYRSSKIAQWDGQERSYHPDSTVRKGEVLLLDGEAYEHLGVNLVEDKLLLRKRKDYTDIRSISPGYLARNFQGEEFTSNKTISLDDYKGKYVFLDFWGTWCAPCVAEMPALKELYGNLDRSKVEFIGIAVTQKPELLKAFLKKKGIAWPQLVSDAIADQYKVTYFPTTLLIDPEGRIVAKDLRAEELHQRLKQFLLVK